jgi:Reverse transcriptase (RNA-dependent DNA polymerase)
VEGWRQWLRDHPDRNFVHLLCEAITQGVKVGYCGPSQHILGIPHPSAAAAPEILTADIQKQMDHDRITRLPHPPQSHFISSPLGLVPKADGGWRRIHDLSYPRGRSVNDHIPPLWGTLEYTVFDEAIEALLRVGKRAILVKRDLADAFRHIPVAESDHWLLGFCWDGAFYIDRFLPFGLRTAPFLFDLFARALHWILVAVLLWPHIFHYLDDFFAILPPSADATRFESEFDGLCVDLGLKVNTKKNVRGHNAQFLGIELDTEVMEARLPPDKLAKARAQIRALLHKSSVTHKELQSLISLLSFASKVVIPGRAFLRRLYDALRLETFYHHVTPAMRADLDWWHLFLTRWNGIKLLRLVQDRPLLYVWTDASSTRGLGGYILDHPSQPPFIEDVFTSRVPTRHAVKDDIQFREMLAVRFAVKCWLPRLAGTRLAIHCDNAAVVSGLKKSTIHGPAMSPLRQLAVLFAVHDIMVIPIWIPTEANELADLLSRFLFEKAAKLYPQLPKGALRRLLTH